MSPPVVETRDGAVCRLTLDRPETRNALDLQMMEALAGAAEAADADPEVRCLLICGSDTAFASGADLRSLMERRPEDVPDHPSARFWTRMAALQTPTVAGVSGWALGGGFELALLCDLIVASERTQFGSPEVTLGIIPGGGATQRIARAAGKHRAMELLLTGRRLDGKEAQRMGLVSVLAKRREWLARAEQLAGVVATRAPVAVRLAKQAVLAADERALHDGLALERDLFAEAMGTEDRVEGIAAFLEKRPPRFQGR